MKLGAVAGMRDDPESFARHAKRLEQAGVSYLWSGEAHSGDKNAAAAMVPAALVEAISLVGDEGFVRDRVAAYAASGVTILNVQPIGPNGMADVETVASWL